MQSESLFELVAAAFAELGTGDAAISRAYWRVEGYFVGHCFHCGGLRATLKLDSELIEFCDADGRLLRAVSLTDRAKRDAA
jgi:hypothetical protein